MYLAAYLLFLWISFGDDFRYLWFQASVETAANLIYRFAAVVPAPHVAAAGAEAATHAAGVASREAAAAAAAASPGIPPSPIALRALTRTAGANAAAAAAAAAGALPLSICYLMLDSYRRSDARHRLAVFYVFHRLMHLSSAARGNAEAPILPGSIEDAGYSVFVLPVVQEVRQRAAGAGRQAAPGPLRSAFMHQSNRRYHFSLPSYLYAA